MKHYKSKIGKYGVRWEPVEGYRRKDGAKILPHYKKTKYPWKKTGYAIK
jgi:hypothetical protein